MTGEVFVLSEEQVERLSLEPGTWWGCCVHDAEGDPRTYVTDDAEAASLMTAVLADALRPPIELERWAASRTLDVPGHPEDW